MRFLKGGFWSWSVDEVCKKLGLDRQIVQKICEYGKFRNTYLTEDGDWKIPEDNFVTTKEQKDEKAEEILQQIDRKIYGNKDITYISAKSVADYYDVKLEKVNSWIKLGYLSGKETKGEFFVPKEEFVYLKSVKDTESTEEELKKLLGSDYIDDLEM